MRFKSVAAAACLSTVLATSALARPPTPSVSPAILHVPEGTELNIKSGGSIR